MIRAGEIKGSWIEAVWELNGSWIKVFSLNLPLDAFEAIALEALLPTILVAVKRFVTEKVHLLDKIKY